MTTRLDIFELTNNVDNGNITFYSTLDESLKKSFHPIVVERWLSGTKSKKQILYINQFLNSTVFPLHNHPDLLYKLMVASSDGKPKRYTWLKKPSKLGSKPTCTKIISEFYSMSIRKAKDALDLLCENEIIAMAEELGYDKEILKKIKSEKHAKN